MQADSSVSQSTNPTSPQRGAATETMRDASGALYPGWSTSIASMIGLTVGPSCILVFCFGSFVVPLQKEFNWGIGAISFGATIISIMIVITAILSGFLADRIGGRKLVLVSLPLFAAGVASLYFLTPSITVFYVALIVISLLGVGVWPGPYNKLTAGWFDRRLGFSLGVANTGIGLGAILLPAVLGYVIPAYGWRQGYLVLGLLALIAWPFAFAMLKERGHSTASRTRALPALQVDMSFPEARRTREFWLALGGFFALGAASSGVVVHLVRILVDTGMTPPQAAGMQAVLGAALLVGRLGTGWLLDHIRASALMAVLCLLGAIALVGLAMGAPGGSAWLCAAAVGLVVGAEFDVLSFLIPRYFGRRSFGVLYGVIFAVFQIGAAVSIGLLGALRGQSGTYGPGLTAVAVLLVVSSALFLAFGTYRNPARRPS